MGDGNVSHSQNGEAVYGRQPYEWKSASLNIAGATATTDITGETGFTELFDTVTKPNYIKVEATDTAYIRLNANDNDVITIGSTSPFEAEYLDVRSLFVSTGGSAVTVTVTLY